MRPATVLLLAFLPAAASAQSGGAARVRANKVAAETAAIAPADPAADIDAGTEVRDWRWIVVHHSATEAGSVESIHAAHKQRRDSQGRPWRGIGYHFVIGNGRGMDDGKVEATFRWRQQLSGAHAGSRPHNDAGIGICLIGNFQDDLPTPAQRKALTGLVSRLAATYDVASASVIGHGDVRATACPGELFPKELLTVPAAGQDDAASDAVPPAGLAPAGPPRKESP